MILRKGLAITSIALAAMLVSAPAGAQRRTGSRKPAASRSGAEGGLLGVKLYDSGLRVVSLYGNPDQIQPIAGGGTQATGGGGGGAGRGGFGGPGSGGGAPGRGVGSDFTGPTSSPGSSEPAFQRPPPQGASSGPPPSGGQPGGPAPSGPGGGGAPGGSTTSTTGDFTRLIYTKSGSKFGFVLDKFNRVVQIEAIGLQNSRVKTRRGIGFGSTFSQVMKAYGVSSPPDGYDVAGDQVTIKFLTRQRVAFRLTKLGAKQAHVVTGIVVAAGKG